MARRLLLVVLILASCSKGPQADMSYISEARSLAAEWALVNEQATQGHVTSAYLRTMRAAVREQLETNSKSLTQSQSEYAKEVAALLKEPDDAERGRITVALDEPSSSGSRTPRHTPRTSARRSRR